MARPSTADTLRPSGPLPALMPALSVNQASHALPPDTVEPTMPLLWVLRDVLQLTATKYGCDNGSCGACTVLLDGRAVRSCQVPLSAVGMQAVTTLEGGAQHAALQAVRQAWAAQQVSHCGYCDSGVWMAAAALLARNPRPTPAEVEAALTHVCPCGATARFHAAIQAAAQLLAAPPTLSSPRAAR